jgi:hypothetical protein
LRACGLGKGSVRPKPQAWHATVVKGAPVLPSRVATILAVWLAQQGHGVWAW